MAGDLKPRPHHEWDEEDGDVLWWLWPIEDAPWVGTPLVLGYTVEVRTQLATSQTGREPVEIFHRSSVGGWPFLEEDLHRVFWTELPDAGPLDVLIRDHIRGGPSEPL